MSGKFASSWSFPLDLLQSPAPANLANRHNLSTRGADEYNFRIHLVARRI